MMAARDRIRRRKRRFASMIAFDACGGLLFVVEGCIEVLGDDTGGFSSVADSSCKATAKFSDVTEG
jgi:hypothetical protein